jgi:hypothetical protein
MLVDKRMEHVSKIQFDAPAGRAPTIEFDLSVPAWYIRFRNAKVAKTISEEKPGVIAAIDLDAKNQVIGLELIGVRQFSIQWLRKFSQRFEPIDFSNVDFERAVFVPAGAD